MPLLVCKVIICGSALASVTESGEQTLLDPDLSKGQKDKIIGYVEAARCEWNRVVYVHSVTVQELPRDQQDAFIEDVELKSQRLARHLTKKILEVIG